MTEKSHSEAPAQELSQAKNSTPVYEIGFHVVPTIPEEGVATVVDAVRKTLEGLEIISEEFPQRMTLAYTIERSHVGRREKFHESYFGWIKFAAERDAIPAIEQALRNMREILRFLLIETDREDAPIVRRAIYTSNRLEGETIKKPEGAEEKTTGPVSDEDLDKSIEALVS